MKVLVTGVNGQLGHDSINELIKRGHSVISSDITESYSGSLDGFSVVAAPYVKMDITDKDSVNEVISTYSPDAVIHCAAWTNVDGAEESENRDKVFRINSDGTRNIAEAVKNIDGKMVYISTDYVFLGLGDKPWSAGEKDFNPLNVYGGSKLLKEKAVTSSLDEFLCKTAITMI